MRPTILILSLFLFTTLCAFCFWIFIVGQTRVDNYTKIRSKEILSQADQAEQVGTIIVGDSITQLSGLTEMCGQSVLNAGVGGARVHQVIDLLVYALRRVKTDRVLIAIGVNDTGGSNPTNIESFKNSYRKLVSIAAATGAPVTVATIAPTGNAFQAVNRNFDRELIKRFNDEIRKIGVEFNTSIAEIYKDLAGKDGFLSPDFTVDGVHLTEAGYQPWIRALKNSACGS